MSRNEGRLADRPLPDDLPAAAEQAIHPMAGTEQTGDFPNSRPKDAATLIVLSRKRGRYRVLMGRRSDRHAFMPGAVVFPGGRVDRADRLAPSADELHPMVEAKLALAVRKPDPRRSRAIALACIRETFEETGIAIGRKGTATGRRRNRAWRPLLDIGVLPTLSPLRLIARAITPPRRSRRFDARFFAVFDEVIAARVEVPDHELHDPRWLTFDEARGSPLPRVTRAVLDVLDARLASDPRLDPDAPVPFYYSLRNRRLVERL